MTMCSFLAVSSLFPASFITLHPGGFTLRICRTLLPCLPATAITISVALATLPVGATPQTPQPAVFAIVGARIEIGDGRVIEKGTVVLRDGIIEAVGADIKAPADAEIVKGDGLTVYPGFIDAYVSKGITLPDIVPIQDTPTDTAVTVSPSMREANRKGIRPEIKAADVLTLTEDILKPERLAGFTNELIVPNGGTINGVGALVSLNGRTRRDCVVAPSTVMDFSFSTSGTGYPGSAMGIIAHTRQTLLDAQYYRTLKSTYEHGGTVRPPDDPTLIALQPVISGSMPALYTANTEREIRRASYLADEFKLNLWINGGLEAYKTTSLLVSKRIPVIVSLNFGNEPGVTAPTGGGGAGATGAGPNSTPGGRSGGGGGRRNRPGGTPGTPGVVTPGTPAQPPTPQPPSVGVQPPNRTTPPGGAPQPGVVPVPGATPVGPITDDTTPKAVVAERHKLWEAKVANAGTLSKAGAKIALSTEGVRSQTEFMTNLRKAIAAGLPREAALKALTIDAARLLNVDKRYGTVEAGKTASIVVMTGDFAEAKTTVQFLFIDRTKFEPAKDTGPIVGLPQRRRGGTDDDGANDDGS